MATTQGNIVNGKTQRIGYIDAMRGFTMFLVVLGHVVALCWQLGPETPTFHHFFTQVRMPMFFFISGFVLYKASVVWNWQHIVQFFKKKIPVQLISPFIFFIIYVHVMGFSLYDSMMDKAKLGYWFTLVLLEYYVFYAAVRFVVRSRWASWILLAMGLFMYGVCWPTMTVHNQTADNALALISAHQWRFFLFFVLGTFTKQYFDKVEQLLDSKWLLPVCIAIYFGVNAFGDLLPIKAVPVKGLLALTGLVIMFSFFRNKQALFSQETRLGRTMQYVGRHTLDIYLIHFFLLPRYLSEFTLFKDYPMPIIEFAVSSLITVIIIAACLLISNIIRLSPTLAHFLFGAKTDEKSYIKQLNNK